MSRYLYKKIQNISPESLNFQHSGLKLTTLGPDGGHVVFGAAIVTASLLGGIMKKPLAVTMLLFLCFPVKMFIWIFIAAAVGSKLITLKPEQEPSANYSKQ